MRATLAVCVGILSLAHSACEQAGEERVGTLRGEPEIALLEDLGALQHSVTTSSAEAQRYFDQGLVLTFGFNHDAAIRSFREATRLDPECAMCFWGIALALGPNINAPMGPDAHRQAYEAAQRAKALSGGATDAEWDYIEALASRYSDDPGADRATLDRAYADAMREVARKHPEDLDAVTLFAEALMDLNPWNYWTKDGDPTTGTPEIVTTLESVLDRNPDHPGAIHYYIHAVEASQDPSRAEAAADRLRGLVPGSGHLTHMPSHIYWRVGRYRDAVETNRLAALSDESYFTWCARGGIYGAVYYPHNIHFQWAAAAASGSSELALTTARRLVAEIDEELLAEFPLAEEFLAVPIETLVRFGRWDAILGEPAPPPGRFYEKGMWHYARGLAYTRRGEFDAAGRELAGLDAIIPTEATRQLEFYGGTASRLLAIASDQLAGEIAAARGDHDAAVVALERAVAAQDALPYMEPPAFYFPTRQALGAVLLEAGRAERAEEVYRKDLQRYPRNGWSLFGLAESLRQQGKTDDAALVENGFATAWAQADVELRASRF